MKTLEVRVLEFATVSAADFYMEKVVEMAKENKGEVKNFKSIRPGEGVKFPHIVETIIYSED